MNLSPDVAEKVASLSAQAAEATTELRNKLWKAEKALAAVRWFAEYGDPKTIKISTHSASSCTGYKEAMEYLNDLLQTLAGDLMRDALENAGKDMGAILPTKQC
ncbi:hypothetical protein LAV_00067 [Sphingobium phage Lacusarx]|uniref:Uncharacterized protein n=1 Tax=Sphingobium phage Lacusarx TaxID=1980139 RepID=A0A1W6DWS3_9CAUD|nr:hypothetical protein FDH44_gp067 [Sphingobium phage Lacusarx]ARK07467.1 hypothetical protein LAV_00067 [Sphingobium phage Lacusarx]